MSKLVLVRHGQSEWNKLNLFTGWKNPDLTNKGAQEAKKAGVLLRKRKIQFDIAFTSALIRAQNTLRIIQEEMDQLSLRVVKHEALNERDYGDLSGLNKDEARQKWGDEKVYKWRRSFDIPPPGGESLKNTAERVLPYYYKIILPEIKKGSDVLIAAHGNSLRSLVMNIEEISTKEIVKLEIGTGIPLIYEVDESGRANRE